MVVPTDVPIVDGSVAVEEQPVSIEVTITTEIKPVVEGQEETKNEETINETEETKIEETNPFLNPFETTDDSVKVVDVPIEKVRWMYEVEKSSWELYSIEASKELEIAHREGKTEYKLTMGDDIHKCNLERKVHTDGDDETEYRLRRHIISDGIQSLWEILSFKYEKPYGLSGQGALKILEKVWCNQESMSGKSCGLGFLFLYSLLSGDSRVKIHGGSSSYGSSYGPQMQGFSSADFYSGAVSFSGFGKSSSSSNDSHRFALLLTQLYVDKNTKALPASIINVLGRNRQVSLRMPKFKDSRKADRSPYFNGWVDETEPKSPVAELFGKVVPMMTTMKRKG